MRFVKAIWKSSLFKISSLNSFSVMIKIAIGLITSKVIAVFVGPSGMALVGNLRNFMASLETVSTLGFQNGVLKYTAENDLERDKLKPVFSTVFISLGAVVLLLSAVLFVFSEFWNSIIFGATAHYSSIFKVLALALPWYAASLIIIAIVNGLSKFRAVIYITIFGNLIGLVVSILMILQFHTFGALVSIVIAPALLFFVAFYYINKEINLRFLLSFRFFSFNVIRKMASYSLMALVSSIVLPLVFLSIRNHIIAEIGIDKAGFWEAITRISTYYLLFISTVIAVYFLPKLVTAKDNLDTKSIFQLYYKTIIPVFGSGLFAVFLAKGFIVKTLFTTAFLPVKDLFFWQLSGDFLKACSLILGYNLIAKKHTIVFIVTECISMAIMFFGTQFLMPIYGIESVVIAHFITYAVYFGILLTYFRKSIF